MPPPRLTPTFTSASPPGGPYSRVEQVYADPTTGEYLTSGVFGATQVLARVTATRAEARRFALALAAGAAGLLLRPWLPGPWRALVGLGLGLAGVLVLASLVVSAYVYDCSGL